MKQSEKVRKVIEDYLAENLPFHPPLPDKLWDQIDSALEADDVANQ